MVTVIPQISQIPEIKRFISRQELEEIKLRSQRVPYGATYESSDPGFIMCDLSDEKGKKVKTIHLATVTYPGVCDSYVNYKKDMESLIRHVEEADKENDYLLERIRQLESVKTS